MTYEPFIVAQEHVDFLRENKIFFHPSGTYPPGWFKPGLRYRALFDLWVEPWSDHRLGPTFSALGAFSYSRSCFGPDAKIGRYCAIGENVKVMGANHPIDRVSMCGFDYARPAPFGPFADHQDLEFPLSPLPDEVFIGGVEIGPDVWIGSGALIARGVKIGLGAVVAANSVVTRDVEPYTVVAGNPARPKKRRFPDALCDRLEASEWWTYSFDNFADMKTTEPAAFLDQFDQAVGDGTLQAMPDQRINIHAAFKELTVKALARQADEEADTKRQADLAAQKKAQDAAEQAHQKAAEAERKLKEKSAQLEAEAKRRIEQSEKEAGQKVAHAQEQAQDILHTAQKQADQRLAEVDTQAAQTLALAEKTAQSLVQTAQAQAAQRLLEADQKAADMRADIAQQLSVVQDKAAQTELAAQALAKKVQEQARQKAQKAKARADKKAQAEQLRAERKQKRTALKHKQAAKDAEATAELQRLKALEDSYNGRLDVRVRRKLRRFTKGA